MQWPMVAVSLLQEQGVLFVEDGNHGNDRPRPGEFANAGMCFIRAADIVNGRVDFERSSRIDDVAQRRIRKGFGRDLDVLLSHKGTVGKVALVPDGSPPFVCSPQTTFWRSMDHQRLEPGFLRYFMISPTFARQLDARSGETDMAAYVSLTEQRKLEVLLPPIEEQRGIAATLGALDDKIESNRRSRALLRAIGAAELAAARLQGFDSVALEKLTTSISRGVSPTYADDDPAAPLVVNQRCIRDGYVDVSKARRMMPKSVMASKVAGPGDVLVNSTGVGTLGRVARWHEGTTFVDSHVTIVKPRPADVDATVMAYALAELEEDIVDMATGSTGQTELSPTRLAELRIAMPARSEMLEQLLLSIETEIDGLLREEDGLAALRDALLPELLSGRIRVPEARSQIQGHTVEPPKET